MQEKNYFLVNFIIRAVLGIGLIFFVNLFLAEKEIALKVGINAVSFITSGFLGMPGVMLLYGVVAIPFL